MIQADYKLYQLPFHYPFTTSKGTKTHQPTMIVYLGLGAQYGLGEATEILYYDMSLDRLKQDMDMVLPEIRRYAYNGPERFWHFLHHLIPDNNFLISALDIASWDLQAKLQGKTVSEVLRLEQKDTIPTDYTIGISSVEDVAKKVAENPYPIYKVKLNNAQDTLVLQWLLAHTDARIRIDANEGWDKETMMRYLPLLDPQRIELIEQPFHRDNKEDLAVLKASTQIPILADEAIQDERSMNRLMHLYDGVVIKLSKCGGITPALRMIEILKKHNKKVMLGSMSESSVGAAAIAQLLPLADYADIDGPLLLQENPAKGFMVDHQGNITLSNPYGIGVSF